MIRQSDVAVAFATFNAAGCRPPKSHNTNEGLEFALRVWVSVLADLEREDLLELTIAYVRTPGSKWWPTPGELLALRVAPADDALEQWGRLLRLVGSKGRARPPVTRDQLDAMLEQWKQAEFDAGVRLPDRPWSLADDLAMDRAMHAGLEAVGGWLRACAMQDRDTVANRAAFRDAYRASFQRRVHALEQSAVKAITAGKLPALLGG
jgi:hypothetical protein